MRVSRNRRSARSARVISGLRRDGGREILGVRIGNTESFATRDETFPWLTDVLFVISGDRGGLTQANRKHLQEAPLTALPGASDAQPAGTRTGESPC